MKDLGASHPLFALDVDFVLQSELPRWKFMSRWTSWLLQPCIDAEYGCIQLRKHGSIALDSVGCYVWHVVTLLL